MLRIAYEKEAPIKKKALDTEDQSIELFFDKAIADAGHCLGQSQIEDSRLFRSLVGQEVELVMNSDGLSAGFIHQQSQALKKAIKKSKAIKSGEFCDILTSGFKWKVNSSLQDYQNSRSLNKILFKVGEMYFLVYSLIKGL